MKTVGGKGLRANRWPEKGEERGQPAELGKRDRGKETLERLIDIDWRGKRGPRKRTRGER